MKLNRKSHLLDYLVCAQGNLSSVGKKVLIVHLTIYFFINPYDKTIKALLLISEGF